MLHKIQIHRREEKVYYSSNAQNELTLDDGLFGHRVVKTVTANLSNFQLWKNKL